VVKRVAKKVKEDNERGARTALIEELFYDFNRSRAQVYVMNFVRGILFGAGSVIGGTIVIAALIWVFSMLANVVPPLDDFFNGVSNTLEAGEQR
jgi:hypothetical protein